MVGAVCYVFGAAEGVKGRSCYSYSMWVHFRGPERLPKKQKKEHKVKELHNGDQTTISLPQEHSKTFKVKVAGKDSNTLQVSTSGGSKSWS